MLTCNASYTLQWHIPSHHLSCGCAALCDGSTRISFLNGLSECWLNLGGRGSIRPKLALTKGSRRCCEPQTSSLPSVPNGQCQETRPQGLVLNLRERKNPAAVSSRLPLLSRTCHLLRSLLPPPVPRPAPLAREMECSRPAPSPGKVGKQARPKFRPVLSYCLQTGRLEGACVWYLCEQA